MTARERVEFSLWLADKAVLGILWIASAAVVFGGVVFFAWRSPREFAVSVVVVASFLLSWFLDGERYTGLSILFMLVAAGAVGYELMRWF